MEIRKSFRFEAAHRLPNVHPLHKCSRLHGHSYEVTVVLSGPVDPVYGWVVDFGEVTKAWQPLHEVLDHYYLNEVEGLENPTSEVLARWVWRRLCHVLPLLSEVCVSETCTSKAVYRGEDEDVPPAVT